MEFFSGGSDDSGGLRSVDTRARRDCGRTVENIARDGAEAIGVVAACDCLGAIRRHLIRVVNDLREEISAVPGFAGMVDYAEGVPATETACGGVTMIDI